jgi:hypothetical protein
LEKAARATRSTCSLAPPICLSERFRFDTKRFCNLNSCFQRGIHL